MKYSCSEKKIDIQLQFFQQFTKFGLQSVMLSLSMSMNEVEAFSKRFRMLIYQPYKYVHHIFFQTFSNYKLS